MGPPPGAAGNSNGFFELSLLKMVKVGVYHGYTAVPWYTPCSDPNEKEKWKSRILLMFRLGLLPLQSLALIENCSKRGTQMKDSAEIPSGCVGTHIFTGTKDDELAHNIYG